MTTRYHGIDVRDDRPPMRIEMSEIGLWTLCLGVFWTGVFAGAMLVWLTP